MGAVMNLFRKEDKKQAEREKAQLLTLKKNYMQTFQGKDAEEVLAHLFTTYHGMTGTFDVNPQNMAFKEGQRSVVMDILHRVGFDYAAYKKMVDTSYATEEDNINNN
jgi:hypothetical protein